MSVPARLQPVPLARPPVTLDRAARAFLVWFEHVRGRSQNTVKSYGFDLGSFAQFCAEHLDLDDPRAVTFRYVELYLAFLRQRGAKATTVNRHLNSVRQLYRYLSREGVTTGNPAADVFSLKELERVPKYLSIPEQERVLAEMAEDHSVVGRRDFALIATALFTGLRVEELVRLKVTDLDLTAGVLRVEQGKGLKGRELPVVPRLRDILCAYLQEIRPRLVERPRGYVYQRRERRGSWIGEYEDGGKRRGQSFRSEHEARTWLAEVAPLPPAPPWVFVNAAPHQSHRLRRVGEPLLTRSVFHLVRRQVAARVGRPVSPHTLRHSFATRLRTNGAPLELIKEALGHSRLDTTLIYACISTPKRNEELARFLEGNGGGKT